MRVQETTAQSADPKSAVAIAQQPYRLEILDVAGQLVSFDLSIHELSDPVTRWKQDRAGAVFNRRSETARLARLLIELRSAGFPSPQPRSRSDPERALRVLIQPRYPIAQTSIFPIAMNFASMNRA